MLVKIYCAAVNGLDVTTVTAEVSAIKGEKFFLSGLGDEAVREAQSRIFSAITINNYKYPSKRITVNLAPAALRKVGAAFDLPIAIGILAADGQIIENHLHEYMIVGELGLDGKLQPIKGALPIAIKARAEKFKGLIVPRQNEREAAVVNNLEVYGMDNITDVIAFLNDMNNPQPVIIDTRREFYENQIKQHSRQLLGQRLK